MAISETSAARAIALRRAYRAYVYDFWGHNTTLAQIVTEGFPDPDGGCEVTRYHVDAMRDLALVTGAIAEGHDTGGDKWQR